MPIGKASNFQFAEESSPASPARLATINRDRSSKLNQAKWKRSREIRDVRERLSNRRLKRTTLPAVREANAPGSTTEVLLLAFCQSRCSVWIEKHRKVDRICEEIVQVVGWPTCPATAAACQAFFLLLTQTPSYPRKAILTSASWKGFCFRQPRGQANRYHYASLRGNGRRETDAAILLAYLGLIFQLNTTNELAFFAGRSQTGGSVATFI